MSTYSELLEQLAEEVDEPMLIPLIPLHMQRAVARYQSIRFWFNEVVETASTAIGDRYVDWPATFIELDTFEVTDAGNTYALEPLTYQELDRLDLSGATGVPQWYAPIDRKWRLYPIPDRVFPLTISGLKLIEVPSGTNEASVWTREAPGLIAAATKASLYASKPATAAAAASMAMVEMIELEALQRRTHQALATGRLRAYS